MKLGIQMLNNSSTLNNLIETSQVLFSQSESIDVYFKLIDQEHPQHSRYIPAAGATVNISIPNINSTYTVSKPASIAFPEDRSIWKVTLSSSETEKISGTDMKVTLTEGGNTKIANALQVLIVDPVYRYGC